MYLIALSSSYLRLLISIGNTQRQILLSAIHVLLSFLKRQSQVTNQSKTFAKSCIIAIINSIAPNEYNFCYIVIFGYIKKAFIYLANKMISSKMIVYLSFYLLTQNLRLIESIEDAPATKGVVVLDSLTFNKTISAFRYSFVSFSISSFTQSLHQLTEEQKQKVAKRFNLAK